MLHEWGVDCVTEEASKIAPSERQYCNPWVKGIRLPDVEKMSFLLDHIEIPTEQRVLTDSNEQKMERLKVEIASRGDGCRKVLLLGSNSSELPAEVEKLFDESRIPLLELMRQPGSKLSELDFCFYLATEWQGVIVFNSFETCLEPAFNVGYRRLNKLGEACFKLCRNLTGLSLFICRVDEWSNKVDPATSNSFDYVIEADGLFHTDRKRKWSQVLNSYPEINEADVNKFACYQLDGRKIDSIVHTAEKTVRYRNEKMSTQHITNILEELPPTDEPGCPVYQ